MLFGAVAGSLFIGGDDSTMLFCLDVVDIGCDGAYVELVDRWRVAYGSAGAGAGGGVVSLSYPEAW